jgi:hypothetical protein
LPELLPAPMVAAASLLHGHNVIRLLAIR